MRTVAQKPKVAQQPAPAKSATLGQPHFGQSHELHPILDLHRHLHRHLHHTIGNQAAQRLLQAHAEESQRRSDTATSTHVGRDFSPLPVHAPAPLRMQPKLAVNPPGDVYEQQADRVAEQVMRMPEPGAVELPAASSAVAGVQRTCACGGTCDQCKSEPNHEHEHLQMKTAGPNAPVGIPAPPIVHEVLRSPGQPLDPATRAFMEPRFARDFGQVRVHTGAVAEESAKQINARAYTVGQNIVFGDGRFTPGTQSGRGLLAHELTHVLQQSAVSNHAAYSENHHAVPPIPQLRPAADFVQRAFDPDWDDTQTARDIDDKAWDQAHPFAYIRERFADLSSSEEDNVGAAFVQLQSDLNLSRIAANPDGRRTLDIIYQAIITGDVSDFQRKQATRILQAKQLTPPKDRQAADREFSRIASEKKMIFPVRNTGLFRISAAVFHAELTPQGKVAVKYVSERVFDNMFQEDRQTLLPWRDLTDEPIELDPDQVVYVRLYDDDEKLIPVHALELIDIGNQSARAAVGKGLTAFFLGLTLGAGALGGGAVEGLAGEVEAGEASAATLRALKIGRTLLWTDRVAFGIQALSFVADDLRDKLPSFVVDALDVANRVGAYYGWTRMGLDGFRFVRSKINPALDQWRAEVPPDTLTPGARAVQTEMENVLNEINTAEQQAGNQAVDFVNEHHTPIEGQQPGSRQVDAGGGHKIVEVADETALSGIGCEFHSNGGPRVPCPHGMGERGEAQPEPVPQPAVAPPMKPRPGGAPRGTTTATPKTIKSSPPSNPVVETPPKASRTFTPEYSAGPHGKADVRGQYTFSEFERGGKIYKRASGRLGTPREVETYRDVGSQRGVSRGTGDDAGHMIGNRFGPPGGAENLSRQNWVLNRFGNYHKLEDAWAALRAKGVEIDVDITDVTRVGEDRPYLRRVNWKETAPGGAQQEFELDFANTTTPESRAASGAAPAGSGGKVIPGHFGGSGQN